MMSSAKSTKKTHQMKELRVRANGVTTLRDNSSSLVADDSRPFNLLSSWQKRSATCTCVLSRVKLFVMDPLNFTLRLLL